MPFEPFSICLDFILIFFLLYSELSEYSVYFCNVTLLKNIQRNRTLSYVAEIQLTYKNAKEMKKIYQCKEYCNFA